MYSVSGLLLRTSLGILLICSKTNTHLRGLAENDPWLIWWPAFVLLILIPLTTWYLVELVRRYKSR